MNKITELLLKIISDFTGEFHGAYNIREDGECAAQRSTPNIRMETRTDLPGLHIYISSKARNEIVYIPACLTHSQADDLVYNDFHVEAGANVTIIAGCGVQTDDEGSACHSGIHSFFLERGAHVIYKEKHIGTGTGTGLRRIDPVTEIKLAEDAVLEMDTCQLGGVDKTQRKTTASLAGGARLIIHESILTEGFQTARTECFVSMDGSDSSADLISRSVARGFSSQEYHSKLMGNCRCSGHSECDAILADYGIVSATPELFAGNADAALIHEAAIGRIAGDQIIKLRTLGLTEKEAEEKIIQGFLRG